MEITFTGSHGLSIGSLTTVPDYFAIRNSQETELNQVYEVADVPGHRTVVINYSGSRAFLPNLADGSTADSYGDVYKFVSVRISSTVFVKEKVSLITGKITETFICLLNINNYLYI